MREVTTLRWKVEVRYDAESLAQNDSEGTRRLKLKSVFKEKNVYLSIFERGGKILFARRGGPRVCESPETTASLCV